MMRLWRIVKLGLNSLMHHPLRSVLAMLGIVLGVASVIAMLAIGAGASEEAQAQIRALGSTTIRLYSRKPPEEQGAGERRQRMVIYGLRYEDAVRIRESLHNVDVIVPVREVAQSIYYGDRRSETSALATEPHWLEKSNAAIARGRWINDVDLLNQTPGAVLGGGLAQKLFDFKDPIGEIIRIGQKPFTVIGVLSPGQDASKAAGQTVHSSDDAAVIPLTTVRERWGERNVKRRSGSVEIEEVEVHEFIVNVQHPEDVIPTADAIRTMLKKFHKKEDYSVLVPMELLEQARKTKRIFSIVLGSIAGISLVVGGIGIMNIMLATVTERTREIGIRRALGARRQDITIQFLAESLVLSALGGLIGVGLGLIVPQIVTTRYGMPTIVSPESLVLSFGISASVGVIFGIYPAIRATLLDPIEALRHE